MWLASYVRPGQTKDGDAGDVEMYNEDSVRSVGFGDEPWRMRLAMKRYKEAHAHLKVFGDVRQCVVVSVAHASLTQERKEHVPHEVGRLVSFTADEVFPVFLEYFVALMMVFSSCCRLRWPCLRAVATTRAMLN